MKQKVIIIPVFCAILLCLSLPGISQDLLRYIPDNFALTASQEHYFNVAKEEATTKEYHLAKVNFQYLKNAHNLRINLPIGVTFTANKSRSESSYAGRHSWIGDVELYDGNVHLVRYNDMLTGFVLFESLHYNIRPLGNGIHVVILQEFEGLPECQTKSSDRATKGQTKQEIEDQIEHPDVVKYAESPSEFATGECKVRYLAAYTTAVGAALADPVSTVVSATNIANTAYANSEVTHRLELCRVYETDYTENASMETDRDRFRINGDTFMDEVHIQRALWKADMCGLLRVGGSGVAYINNSFGYVFQTTNHTYIGGRTWTHEIGHNHRAEHNEEAGGNAPYQGWGDKVNGCYRTIMAYSSACGGMSPCTRQDILSDNTDSWTCSATNYTPGDSVHRNADRHNLSTNALVNHYTVLNYSLFAADYEIKDDQYVSHVANNHVGYSRAGGNMFRFYSGSSGEFRASNKVTLGPGFHARSGSKFKAHLESCTALRPVVSVKNNTDQPSSPSSKISSITEGTISLFPNPTKAICTISFSLKTEKAISLRVFDVQGKVILSPAENIQMPAGLHSIDINAGSLQPGVYSVLLISGDKTATKRMLVQ